MKINEFIIDAKKPPKMPQPRDPNWRTLQAKGTSGAGGPHRDEKRAEKLGDVKHKKDLVPVDEQGVAETKKDSDELAKYENDVKTLLANGDVKTAKKVAGLSPDAAHRNRLRNIIRRYDSKQGVAEGEYKKLSTQEKLKRNLKRAGYDVDASVKRIDDLIAKQKKSREEFEKRHQNKEKDVAEANYFNPLDQERGEQAYSDREKREFKRRELQHELGHETNNVSIDINGKTWKVLKGEAEYPQRALARAAKIAATIKSNAVARGRKEPDVKVYVTGAPATD